MNHRQLGQVRTSFERLRVVRLLFAELFHRRLLFIAPALERHLPADPAERDRAFLDLVEAVVRGLDRLDVLLPALGSLAQSWSQRGVRPADYEITGDALVWTVQQVLGEAPGASEIVAWRETYDLLAHVMMRAAAEPCPASTPLPRRPLATLPCAEPAPASRRSAPPASRRSSPPPASRRSSLPPQRITLV